MTLGLDGSVASGLDGELGFFILYTYCCISFVFTVNHTMCNTMYHWSCHMLNYSHHNKRYLSSNDECAERAVMQPVEHVGQIVERVRR